MSRAVYIGGFGNGKKSAEGVGNALSAYYDNIDIENDTFTFSSSGSDINRLARIVEGADAYVHSYALARLIGTKPREIFAFSPVIPTSRMKLLGKTIVKAGRMMSSELTLGATKKDVLNYNVSSVAELASHPYRNFKPLFSGEISAFDAIDTASRAKDVGIHTHLIYSSDDEFFQPTYPQERRAYKNGTPIKYVPGVHDQLVLTPELMLRTALVIVNS